jgi:hypothetical protein
MAWKSCVSESRRRVHFARAAVVFCLGLAVFVSPPFLSAHVELMSVSEIAAASPDIVVATVEGRRSRWNELHTLILTDYTLRVEERLRGTAADRISITVPGGTLGKVSDDTCISVHLQPGARYLLFLGDLGHPTLTPVVGGEQGVFPEVPREAPGTQVTFRDFVGAVRSLAARISLAPRPIVQAAAALPAKTWNPAATPVPIVGSLPPRAAPETVMPPLPGEDAPEIAEVTDAVPVLPVPPGPRIPAKFLFHELANRPVIVNPLTDSEFSPWDQVEMANWNRYSGDLFRVLDPPTSSWAYNNGVSDMVGFPDDVPMKRQFGYDWAELGAGVLAVTFARREEGVVVEADVAFNPHKSWTTDDLVATGSQEPVYSFQEAALHELGHVWGLLHPWDEEEWVTWDSVMNYKPRIYYTGELFADDTAAVRHAFPPGVSIRDGLISSYVTVRDEIIVIPDYRTALPTLSTVRAGGGFGLTGPIKIENVGTVPLVDPTVEVYLAPARLSFDGAVLVKRAKVRGKILPSGTLQVKLSGFKVPRGTPAGAYYLAYFLRDPKDAYQGNNAAWGLDGVTVMVTR